MAEWCSGFFVGPYAEFLVGPDGAPPEENYGAPRPSSSPAPFSRWGAGGSRHVFWAAGPAGASAASSGPGPGAVDLSHVIPAEEVRRFAAAYSAALSALARHYGVEPALRWVLVWYDHDQYSVLL